MALTLRKITDAQIERASATTLESTPRDAIHWSARDLAKREGLSQSAVARDEATEGVNDSDDDAFMLFHQLTDTTSGRTLDTSTSPERAGGRRMSLGKRLQQLWALVRHRFLEYPMPVRQLVACASAALLLNAGCGGGSPTSPNETPSGGPLTFTGQVFGGTQDHFGDHAITVSKSGTANIVLTWSGTVDLDLYVTGPFDPTTGGCGHFYFSTCGIILKSATSRSGNTETLSLPVTANQQIKVWAYHVTNQNSGPKIYTIIFTVN